MQLCRVIFIMSPLCWGETYWFAFSVCQSVRPSHFGFWMITSKPVVGYLRNWKPRPVITKPRLGLFSESIRTYLSRQQPPGWSTLRSYCPENQAITSQSLIGSSRNWKPRQVYVIMKRCMGCNCFPGRNIKFITKRYSDWSTVSRQ